MENVTTEQLKELQGNGDKLLVDFWAPWCGPCRALAPTLDTFANETDSVVVAKVNVDEYPEIAQNFQVRGIPTLILFDKGVVKKRVSGNQQMDELKAFVN